MNTYIRTLKIFTRLLSGLFVLSGFTFSGPEKDISIHVKPVFGKQDLLLDKKTYITANHDTISVSKLRFYISGIKILFRDNSVYTENNSYHLIDAEEEQSLRIKLTQVPQKEIAGLHFNIGVDSLASVSGALDGDLDPVKGMYWAWNSGYINAKLEGKDLTKGIEENEFEFHIGGYLPPYQSIRQVHLTTTKEEITPAEIIVIADVEAWFSYISLKKTNRIVIPGAEAVKMADDYTKMFRLEN
ncbi:MAG: hypothetical protein K0S33_1922 [Bacteroidetes bacterium]|jgi:hypothetical protein|nr:hypothetical protein [Bacteroidota bacterium]